MLHIDDLQRIDTYIRFLGGETPNVDVLSTRDQRLLRMLVASMMDALLDKETDLSRLHAKSYGHTGKSARS